MHLTDFREIRGHDSHGFESSGIAKLLVNDIGREMPQKSAMSLNHARGRVSCENSGNSYCVEKFSREFPREKFEF